MTFQRGDNGGVTPSVSTTNSVVTGTRVAKLLFCLSRTYGIYMEYDISSLNCAFITKYLRCGSLKWVTLTAALAFALLLKCHLSCGTSVSNPVQKSRRFGQEIGELEEDN